MSCQQNAGQNCNTSIVNKSFENMEKLKYLGTMLTTHNHIYEEQIKTGERLLPFNSKPLSPHL
jgi:hypothetical protein